MRRTKKQHDRIGYRGAIQRPGKCTFRRDERTWRPAPTGREPMCENRFEAGHGCSWRMRGNRAHAPITKIMGFGAAGGGRLLCTQENSRVRFPGGPFPHSVDTQLHRERWIQALPSLTCFSGVIGLAQPPCKRQIVGSSPTGSSAESTEKGSARPHKPCNAGSSPVSAIRTGSARMM